MDISKSILAETDFQLCLKKHNINYKFPKLKAQIKMQFKYTVNFNNYISFFNCTYENK